MKQEPTILIIFGATGDLARRKIIPALWHLWREKKLPAHLSLVGFSRRDLDNESFRAYVRQMIGVHTNRKAAKAETDFVNLFTFVPGFFDAPEAYDALSARIAEAGGKSGGAVANKLFYLAVSPDQYETVLKNIAHSGLADSAGGQTRVIVEKPFGKDAATAQKLDELLASFFHEDQIYRIDHYLAKEMIQNILAFRFSNNLFEKNWSRETIERIDIRLWERIGAEERGGFYDGVGALRDVGQNHLLQMLALVTMDRPESFDAPSLRKARARILRSLRTPSRKDVIAGSVRGQYAGYRAIRGVAPDSETETYFKVAASLAAPRWSGVFFSLESGKRMGEQKKEVVITFRHPEPCLCPPEAGKHFRNKIILALEPEERITIHFWSKKPGFAYDLEERTFTFLLRQRAEHSQYVEEYKKLLLDCITGDQTLFVSTEEVREMWRFTDPMIDAWMKNLVPLQEYEPDTSEIVEQAEAGDESYPAAARRGSPEHPRRAKEIGLIGLGKMGRAMAERLAEKGWRVVVYDEDPKQIERAAAAGIEAAANFADMIPRLPRPRLIWLMVPSFVPAQPERRKGKSVVSPVDQILFTRPGLVRLLGKGDTIIDGGNSFYEDSVRRAGKLKTRGIHFFDVGVSGGPEGARHGACLMIGGEKKDFKRYEHLFRDLASPEGYAYLGKSGAGHFAKMIHNGIEYGVMQSLAEGFAVLKKSPFRFDLANLAGLYQQGSVIESRLVAWLKKAYDEYGVDLKKISGAVGASGEGEWTVKTAKKMKIVVPAIEDALKFRLRSFKNPSYAGKILTALRHQFGGHSIT